MTGPSSRRVRVTGVPGWVSAAKLLGDSFSRDGDGWVADLEPAAAADVAARLRGVSIGGSPLLALVEPSLSRPLVRAGRERDARARRDTSPGFSRPGARLDEEGRWSLTPEALAFALGREARGQAVIDATCGAGGNAIGFARAGCPVTAIERDPGRLALARHNASVYGVSIRFLAGEAERHLPSLPPALVFVDPPWGTDWPRDRCTLRDLPALSSILAHCRGPVWAKVPPSFDPAELPGGQPEAVFGVRPGDAHRVKFLVIRIL